MGILKSFSQNRKRINDSLLIGNADIFYRCIVFCCDSGINSTGEIQKVVMKDEVKPTETPTETPEETPETPETKDTETTKTSTSPKTGDNTPILFWILLAGVGMAGVGGTVILRKKKKK